MGASLLALAKSILDLIVSGLTKLTSIRDSQVSVILVGVVIFYPRLVSDKKLDKALLSGLSFKTLQLRSPKTAMGLCMVSA